MARQATSETRVRERSRMGTIHVARCAPRISAQVFAPLLREIFRFCSRHLRRERKQTVTV